MNYELAVTTRELDFDTLQRMSLALYKSGFFGDVKSEAQAIVKVMAGQELGLPPFASMSGIHIIQGKPVLGANVIATLVKNDPRYNYRPVRHDDTACTLAWYENGELVGEASFTMEEAKAAGLTNKDNWKKYPSDMLFARAISRGARRFAPGIFGGAPVYTPDEMGVDMDEEGYTVVNATPMPRTVDATTGEITEGVVVEFNELQSASANGNGEKPFYAAVVKETPFYASPQDVEDTMALLNLSYPTRADEARQHRATLAEYAQLVADGKSQAEAVATLTKQEQPATG